MRKISALVRSSSHTNGAVAFDSHSIGRDTIAAIGSGERSANCLGTSSPMTSETKVVMTMTMLKPTVCAVSGSSPSKLQPLRDRPAEAGARISAGEDADQRDADLHRRQEAAGVGGEVERDLRAAAADLAIAFSRASRDETIASSLIANTPLSAISARIRTRSNQGMGASGSLIEVACKPCLQIAPRSKPAMLDQHAEPSREGRRSPADPYNDCWRV